MREGLTIPQCNVPVSWINDARIKRRFCIWKRGEPPSIYFFKASYFLKFLFRTKNQTLVKVNIKNNIRKRDTIRYSPLPCFEKQTLCISYWHLYNWISIFFQLQQYTALGTTVKKPKLFSTRMLVTNRIVWSMSVLIFIFARSSKCQGSCFFKIISKKG